MNKQDYINLGTANAAANKTDHPYDLNATSWQAKAYWEGYANHAEAQAYAREEYIPRAAAEHIRLLEEAIPKENNVNRRNRLVQKVNALQMKWAARKAGVPVRTMKMVIQAAGVMS